MNKFLKKRSDGPAAHDDALSSLSRPSSPTPKKSSTSRWKKNKKQPEVRPQLDLTMALPSADDFRTSLIMPSLSTRFSMLKEQDDPNSLLGKASDDSVIQPRRKSRLADFGFGANGLSDIAEVSSIHGSVRPPFAQRSREQSYVSEDGYGSDAEALAGSVMSRSRPGEGNILFGGRQKIYKIAATGAHSTKSLGKLVYDDDVGVSAFQKYRHREREEDESHFPRPSNESQGFDFGLDKVDYDGQDDDGQHFLPDDSTKNLSHSPSLSSYDKKRSTTSSDAHSIARSSTAATSIASQPAITSAAPSPAHPPVTSMAPAHASAPLLDRSNTKARRLYEQGLDQHLQEQQTSAITRLNSIQRQRAMSGKKTPPFLHSTKSAGNLHDRAPQSVYALRGQTPPPTSPIPQLNTFGSVKHAHSNTPSPVPSGPHSPIDGQFDEASVLAQALEPGDRGKATAMGAFNKPAHAFDEQQYLERQKQLQRSTSSAAGKTLPAPPQSAFQHRINRYEDEQKEQQQTTSPDQSSRPRFESAPKKHEPSQAWSVFQNAVNQFPSKGSPTTGNKSPLPDTHRTFFGNISASEDEDEDEVSEIARSFNQPEYGYGGYGRWQPTPLPSVSEHPASGREKSKASLAEEAEEDEPPKTLLSQKASARSLRADTTEAGAAVPKDLDSPTLGPQSQPLNGMVHRLRQKSNQPSVYPTDDGFVLYDDSVPGVSEVTWDGNTSNSYGHTLGGALDTRTSIRGSRCTVSNPWDLDEAYSTVEAGHGDSSPVNTASAFHPERISDGSVYEDDVPNLRSRINDIPAGQNELTSWQQELRKQQHTRDPSNATMQERDAFTRELAARREAVKENLKSYHEINSRATSPVPTATPQGGLRAFGMVRAKTSRESLANLRDQPPKALKTLGVVVNGHPSVNNLVQEERNGYSLDMERARVNSSPRPPLPPPVSQHPAFKNDIPEGENEYPKERQLASSRSPALSNGRNRSRSNSAATTGRSRSRTGPYRDDLEKAMIEGHGSTATAHETTREASPAFISSNRDSDGSRAIMQAYFDQKNGPPGNNARMTPNGPPSAPLTPNVYTPGRPAPVANPYTSNPTPPLSEPSQPSPVTISPAAFSAAANSPALSSTGVPTGPLRKKTISKHDISEPTFIHSTSNIDTINLPEGASLKNGMDEPPPIPPINPRRRGTRKLFGLGGSKDEKDGELPKATQSDPNLLLHASPTREQMHFPPSNVVRMPPKPAIEQSPALQQYSFNPNGSPERASRGPTRAVTAPMNNGMF